MRHLRPPRAEDGVAVLWGIALIGVLLSVALAGAAVAAIVAAHRQAQAAADLAALAGAVSVRDGGAGCPVAQHIAERNRGDVVRCRASGRTVRVEVVVPLAGPFGQIHRLRARAVAGPAGAGAGLSQPELR